MADDSHAEFYTTASTNPNPTMAIVALPGFTENAAFFNPVLADLAKIGPVTTVTYAGNRFFPRVIVDQVEAKVRELRTQYDKVVLIGMSMGGDLSADVVRRFNAGNGERQHIQLVLCSSPMGAETLQLTVALQSVVLSSFASGDYLENPELRKIFASLGMNMSLGTNYQVDQSRYIATYSKMLPGEIWGTRSSTYIKSSNDETVNNELAFGWWNLASFGTLKTRTVQGPHVGLRENPAGWAQALTEVLTAV